MMGYKKCILLIYWIFLLFTKIDNVHANSIPENTNNPYNKDMDMKIDEITKQLNSMSSRLVKIEAVINNQGYEENAPNENDILFGDDLRKDEYKNELEKELDADQPGFSQRTGFDVKNATSIEIYNKSLEEYRLNNLDESESLLTRIVNIGSDSSSMKNLNKDQKELLANSYYLIGEIYVKRPDHEKAAIAFLKAYKEFSNLAKDHPQAGNSLIKLAYALHSSGNKTAACNSLVKLNKDFGSADQIKQIAESEIVNFKCSSN